MGETLLTAVQSKRCDCVKTIVDDMKDSLNPDEVFEALHLAVTQELVSIVEILVGIAGEEINRCDENGYSLAFIAMMKANKSLLIALLKGRPDIDHKVMNDRSLLHYAVSKTWIRLTFMEKSSAFISSYSQEFCQILIDSGTDLAPFDRNYFTPLHIAIEESNMEAIKILLKYNVNTDGAPDTDSPLHFAVRKQNLTIIKMLMKSGASLGIKNSYGDTPLHLALRCRLANMVSFLIAIGENIGEALNVTDSQGETVLHIVTKYGCLAVIEALLAKGSDPNFQDSYGYTALMHAVTHIPTMAPYHWAESQDTWSKKMNRKVCQLCAVCDLLIKYKANAHICNNSGRSSFEEALICGKFCVLNVFLKVYTSQNLLNHILFTSLNYCNRSSSTLYVIQVLVESGADVNAHRSEDGFTMLHKAIVDIAFYTNEFKCILKIINLLISCGADVNAVNNDKKTPLHLALELNNKRVVMLHEVVEILLENGADVFAPSDSGETPLSLVQCLKRRNVRDKVFYYTLLYLAASWPSQMSDDSTELTQHFSVDRFLSGILLHNSNSKIEFLRLLKEVSKMKVTFVYSVSLYDLFIADTRTLLEYFKNDDNLSKFMSGGSHCCYSYAPIINAKVTRALKIQNRQNILESGKVFMIMISNMFNIPSGPLIDCSDTIFKYLCFRDLKNLRCVVDGYFS